ncbi:MAG: hypothetical protein HN580_18555 [Deltaproteobacteria bacterium]|jgi:hypothetical protein|nr:hypothetical protein [Deltaproteobacteria bacterium]MBT4267082.1 hypothetical protein [Deltaproteobacteria bacterium]MBT4638024.1 hypothetical protein [Deltaproteobacteria bacterium]MBT6503783.1 hypothetical protein [Deltaproteobacteria bacterium]MBT7155967.1 hypothetical protein [Deltaproteobacteria bacterium]
MIRSICYQALVVTGSLLFLSLSVFAYEPTFREILIKKKHLDSFCKLVNNQRQYDICEKFKSLRGKLPDHISEFEIFEKAQKQPAK